MMIDDLHNQLIKRMNITNLRLELKLDILHKINKLLQYRIPDFSQMGIDELLDLRKDQLFKKFRAKLIEINNVLTNKSLKEMEEFNIESLFMHECLKCMNLNHQIKML